MQHPAAAQTKIPVSIELVLAVDTSLSVDPFEYDLQMTGIANAFRSPEIISLIQQHEGVAVALFQWSSRVDKRFVIPWHLLRSPTSVLSFAEKVEYAARDPVRGFTAIGGAIDLGIRMIAENNYEGLRLKIDISGDGRNNQGITPAATWLDAQAQGIVINGLPILVDTFNLDAYFREKVIHGPGAFIEIAMDYNDFAQVFYRKLKRELSPMISENNFSPGVLSQRPVRMTHLMRRNSPLARRIAQRDAGYRASNVTTSKGRFLLTEGRFTWISARPREGGDRCGNLMVPRTTSMTAPSRKPGKAGQMGHSYGPLVLGGPQQFGPLGKH